LDKHTYNMYHERPYKENDYVGKHEKKWYNVYRVLGPTGPEERFPVLGLDEAKEAAIGCWDWEVTDTNGNVINI